jgi:hypothetical protein
MLIIELTHGLPYSVFNFISLGHHVGRKSITGMGHDLLLAQVLNKVVAFLSALSQVAETEVPQNLVEASCERSSASSRLPTKPSAMKYASFIYLLTTASKASLEPPRQRRRATASSSRKLVNFPISKAGRYDAHAGSYHLFPN